MKTLRAFLLVSVGAGVFGLSGCHVPPSPPPPRVNVTYQAPVYEPPKTTVLFVPRETDATPDTVRRGREDALSYLRRNGYLRDNDVLVDDAAMADRIIRVTPSNAIGGGYDVRVFTPGDSSRARMQSSRADDDWDEPRSSVMIIRPRFYHDPFWDPWFYRYPSVGFHGFYYRDLHPHHHRPHFGIPHPHRRWHY
mgnify:CR=1 FL=1